MKLIHLNITLLLIFLMFGCQSTNIKIKSHMSLELNEINGIKSYEAGDYETAFKLLKTPAAWGYKGSQYALAFMFLKGQYVEQSTLLGMGWLGVATEKEIEVWSDQYRSFYASAKPPLKAKIDKIVDVYIQRYGMKAQHVTCKKQRNTVNHRHTCTKAATTSTLYDIDLVE